MDEFLEAFLEANPDFRPIARWVASPPDASQIKHEWPDADSDLLDRCYEAVLYSGFVISRGTLYWRSRLSGNSDRFAALVSLEQPAGCETTDTFWAGRKRWDQVFAPGYVEDVKRRLAAQGVEIGDKEYMPELARYRGDPEGVVPFSGARNHMKKLMQKRGWAMNGAVTTKHREPESDPHAPENCKPLADHIVARTMKEMVKANPDLKHTIKTPQGRRTLREKIIAKHGRQ